MTHPKYSIVIPVYRSGKTLMELSERIIRVFDETIQAPFELILVDDASPDNSWEVMREIRSRDSRVKILQLARNFGQHSALMCGFNQVQGDYVVTLDDDLQHPPEEIPKLIAAFEAHPDTDVVIGAYETKRHSWVRNLGTRGMDWVGIRILGKKPGLQFTSFRLMRGLIVRQIVRVKAEKPRVGQLVLAMTHRIINTPVQHDARKYGRSGYTFPRLVKDFISNILNNSAIPLKLVSYLGFFSSALSFLLALYYLYRYFFIGISIAGWTTLVLLTLFYFGVLLFSVGIIGEYLIRILKESKRMPQFVIRDKQL